MNLTQYLLYVHAITENWHKFVALCSMSQKSFELAVQSLYYFFT